MSDRPPSEFTETQRLTWAIAHPYEFKEIYNWLRCAPDEQQARFRQKIDEALRRDSAATS